MKIISRVSKVDASKCVGCKTCEKHCPTGAIKVVSGGGGEPYVSPCQKACPAGVNVPGYIALAANGRYEDAYRLIRRDNPFPSVCGRICTHPCQEVCNRGCYDNPVAIRDIKRFVADKAFEGNVKSEMVWAKNGKSVAIIGAGPSGLTCAYYLALSGYEVNVYDSAPVAGGVLAFGIPEWRLPKDVIDREVKEIENVGVKIHLSTEIGKDISFDDLKNNNDAVYIATGTQFSRTAGVKGEELSGVYHGLDFLRDVNLGNAPVVGKKVVVVGGGNTAMDTARTALRLGAEDVSILYRRREVDMPADAREIMEAKEEGIKLITMAAPLEFVGGETVEQIRCVRMALGEVGADGRRATHAIDGDEFMIDVDNVIVAVSQYSDFPFISKEEVEMTKWGNLIVNDNLMTTMPGVFAGGDVMRGSDTAISAIADGKKAAAMISKYLGLAAEVNQGAEIELPGKENMKVNNQMSGKMPCLDPIERVKNNAEVALGLTEEALKFEAERCSRCSGRATVDATKCIDCGMCWEQCPHDAITLEPLEKDRVLMPRKATLEEVDFVMDICKKAYIMPDAKVCACGMVNAEEVICAIKDGAHTMEDLAIKTGVRGGCNMYCIQGILRIFEAMGYPQTEPDNDNWHKIETHLFNIPEAAIDHYPVLKIRHIQEMNWNDALLARKAEALRKSKEA